VLEDVSHRHNVEAGLGKFEVLYGPWMKVACRHRCEARPRAQVEVSTPVTVHPDSAAMATKTPVAQPMSSRRPERRPMRFDQDEKSPGGRGRALVLARVRLIAQPP